MVGNLIEGEAQCFSLVGDMGGPLGWWPGCQPGVMVLTDFYGELMPSGMSWETLTDRDLTAVLGLCPG